MAYTTVEIDLDDINSDDLLAEVKSRIDNGRILPEEIMSNDSSVIDEMKRGIIEKLMRLPIGTINEIEEKYLK